MKFRCERDELLTAVQFASRAISNRASLPVLAGLRLQGLESGRVQVAATDLELTMETSFQAGVDEPGDAIVPGRLFGDVTRSLGAGQVTVAGGEGEVEIGSGRGLFRVKTLMASDYPSLPIDDDDGAGEGSRISLSGEELAAGLSQVVRAASTDETRQVLTGVLWEIEGGQVTLAATDSYRLGVRTLAIGEDLTEARRVVVPARTLAELARSVQAGFTSLHASVRDNLVSFMLEAPESGDRALIGSRYIEGEFPKYRQLIPQGYPNRLTVGREELLEVTKRVGLLAQNNLPVKLNLGPELEISAHTPDVGEAQEVIDASYEGEPFVIAFNPQFLYDGVSALRGDRVVMEVGDGLKPALLKGEGDDSYTYLLMPVRLS